MVNDYLCRRFLIAEFGINKFLSPRTKPARHARIGILTLLGLSFLALLLAPLFMPEGYSWIANTTSESAAQGLEYAWVARMGFLLFGLAVLWLASAAGHTWGWLVVWMHIGFGVMMLATAAFSHKPFLPGVPFDPVEDFLHSFTATVMGFAFSFGVFARFLQRGKGPGISGLLDLAVIGAAIFIPLWMVWQPGMSGLVQRVMFLLSYVWYGAEAWRLRSTNEIERNP